MHLSRDLDIFNKISDLTQYVNRLIACIWGKSSAEAGCAHDMDWVLQSVEFGNIYIITYLTQMYVKMDISLYFMHCNIAFG